MQKLIKILLFSLLPLFSMAQSGQVEIFGKTEDADNNRKMGGVEVVIYKEGAVMTTKTSGGNGKYEALIPVGAVYKIEYKKLGYVSKFLTIDLSNVKQEDFGNYNLPMDIDMSLFLMVDGVDFSLLKSSPIGKATWDPKKGVVAWDFSYTSKMQKEIQKLMDSAKKKKEEENEKLKKFNELVAQGDQFMTDGNFERTLSAYEEAKTVMPDGEGIDAKIELVKKKIEEAKNSAQQYDKLIQEGDQAFNGEDYETALDKYNQALILKPSEKYPSDQMIKIEEKMAELEKRKAEEAEKEQQYQNLITAADNLLAQKDYEKAIEKYQEASTMKPAETYPKTKVAEIEGILSDMESAKEAEKKYNDLITAADQKFSSKEYKAALAKYQEASTLKSNEQYPKDKIAEVNKILDEQNAEAELNRKYDEAIQKADQYLAQKEYESAKASYETALTLKPDESYPKSKIAEIAELIKNQAALKEQQDKYDAFIKTADGHFNSEEWEDAKTSYESALTVFPNEEHPKNQIQKIEKKLKEIEDNLALEKKFADLVKEADDFFTAEKWTEAKDKYNAALEIKQSDTHSKTRIMEINEKLRALQSADELEEQYKNLITKADAAYQSENYEDAKKDYQAALDLKPNEAYPKTQLSAIEAAIKKAEEEALTKKYQAVIADADQKFDSKDYDNAKSKYEEALTIKPDEAYPKDKIKAIEDLIAKAAQKEAELDEAKVAYDKAIKEGDQMFADQQWQNAIEKYKVALKHKPNESYPKSKIAEANEKLKAGKAEAELLASYNAEIAKADKAFDAENYEESKNLYKKAALIKSDETYPQEQIDKINSILKDETAKQLDEQYQKIITKADSYFNGEDYDNAKIYYDRALSIKPDDKYPKDKLDEIAQIKANKEKVKEVSAYQKVIGEADALFEQKKWKSAKEKYKEAYQLKNDQYPQDQINKINEAMKEQTNADVMKQYQKIIDKADGLFATEDYEDARSYYVRASNLNKTDSYPKSKIAEIDDILAKKAQQDRGIAMTDYGAEVKDQTVLDGQALLIEAEAMKRHQASQKVVQQDDKNAQNNLDWKNKGKEQTFDMVDSTEILRKKMAQNAQDLGLIREKNEYEVGSYEVERDELNANWNRYDETDMHRTTKYADGIRKSMEVASINNDEPRKQNELDVVENNDLIDKERKIKVEASYDASYDVKIKVDETSDNISENAKNADLDRQQNELDVTAFNEEIDKVNQGIDERSTDDRMEMRDLSEETKKNWSTATENADLDRVDGEQNLIVYNDDRSDKYRKQAADDYDEIIFTNAQTTKLKEDMSENAKDGDKLSSTNSSEVIKEKDYQDIKRQEIAAEDYNQITEVKEGVEKMKDQMTENTKNADETRKTNNSEVVKYSDNLDEAKRDQGAYDDDEMHRNRDKSEDIKSEISETNKERGKLVDDNNEDITDLKDDSEIKRREVSEKGEDNKNNTFDLLDDNYRSYDKSKYTGEFANALATEYPAGVTEKSYNVTDENGLVIKVVTRRIVVIGGRGDVYERVQTRFGLSYFKNGSGTTEYTWQSETADATLTRHK